MGDLKEIKQWRKKAKPHIFALEPRMLFDAVSVVDTQINETKNLDLITQDLSHIDSTSLNFDSSSTSPSQLTVIGDVNLSIPALIDWQNALISAQKSFADFLNSDRYLLTLSEIFKSQDLDLNLFNESAESLRHSMLSIGLNAQLELRSSSELKGYLAAYHFDQERGQDRIYINRDWIEFGVGQAMINRAILEEMGHALDHHLNNTIDSLGDEGEYFSRILTNDFLSADEINRIKNENDHSQILIDGKYIDVEFASITFTKAYEGLNSLYTAIGTNYAIQTSSIFIKTPISSTAYTFESAFPSDVTFSGNNVAGSLTFFSGGNKYTYNGVVSRPDKTGNTPKALYFAETTVLGGQIPTGKAFLLVMPGYESSYTSSNQSISTSSDPIDKALNDVQTSQASNDAPIITSNGGGDSASISFAENTLASVAVTTVQSTDADAGDTKIYSIYAGADATLFSINSSSGVLTFKSSPNYENPLDVDKNNIYDVRVMVADSKGATDTQTLSVNVTNVNDNVPTITSNGGGSTASISVPQLTTAVTKVIATDADIADALSYSITGGTNSSLFSIDASSGQLAFKSAPTFNVSGSNSYQVIVTASDGTNTDSQTITVSVTNVDNIAPTLAITSDKSLLGAAKTATITFTFSENVQGFTLSDVIVAGGSLGNLVQDPSYPNIYRATFTQSGSSSAPSFTVASSSYQDLSNNNGSEASLGLSYDVIAPTVTVDIAGTDIAFGQTKIVTFTFSEDPVGTFTIGDITSTNGLVTNLIQSNTDSKVFTASIQSTSATGGPVVVAVGGSYTDAAGNLGSEGSDSATLGSPSIDLANTTASDTGSSSVDNITSNRKPVIVGNALVSEATVKVTITSGATTLIYNSVSVSGGLWSLNLSTATPSSGTMPLAGLAEGYVGLTVTLNSDATVSASSSFLIDITSSSVPTVVSQTANTSTPTLSGTTASDTDVLNVTVNGITYTSEDGYLSYIPGTTTWSLTIPSINALSSATYGVVVVSYDVAGNSSTDTTNNELTVNLNTAAPILDLAPSDGATKNNSATYTQSGNAVAFTLSGTNISDSDSTTFATLTVSYSLSSIESGDRFEIGSTIVYLSSTSATGSVYFNGTYFNYAFIQIGGTNYLQFTSRDGTNANNALGPIASYETLIDALKFSNDASSFTNNSTRVFSVSLNDGSQSSSSAQFTVTMATLNSAPTVTSASSTTFAENATGTVYTVTGTDPDAGTTLSYSISGTDAALFDINSSTGAITFKASPNYESPSDIGTNNVYDITVTASDGTLTNNKAVTITVTNVDDIAPAFTSATTGTAAENQNQLYTAVATDTVDFTTGVVTYSLKAGTGDVASLSINSSSGVVTLTSGNLDYETKSSYSFTVIATDATGNTREQAVTITVTNVNEAPTVTSASSTTFAENATGTVYTVTGTDPDAGTTLSYSISGTDAALFDINSSTGAITFKASPNYESPSDIGTNNVYDITVTASDGTLTNNKAVTITVTNVDDIAPAFTSATTGTAAENQNQLYTAVATDTVDFTTGVVTYSLKAGTGDVASLSINSSSGVVTLTSGNLDYETKSSYSFTVIATDATGNTREQAVTITVTNVNEAPTVTSASSTTFAENATGTVYTVTGTDPDAGTTLSYSISGTDAALFDINSSTGAITFKASPNYESPSDIGTNNVYDITVTASDGTLTNNKAVTITVTNVDDNEPSILNNDTKAINQNNNATGNVLTNDSDIDDILALASFSVAGDLTTYTFDQTATIVDKGTITIAADGSYTFTPLTDWSGTVPTITYTSNTGLTATLTITVVIVNDDDILKLINRPRVLPPVITPNDNKNFLIDNDEEMDHDKFNEDEDEISIAIKPHFSKASLVNTQLKNSSKPLKIASPEAPSKGEKTNTQGQKANDQKNDTSLKNTLTPPDAIADNKGQVVYKLPEGTFTGGQGAISLHATQKDGSPLPSWIKFDATTGKINADVPKGLSAPIEVKVQATDSKGDKAETVIKIQPRTDKVSFIGKKSLSAQFKDAFVLVA